MGLPSQLELLAVFIHKLGHDNMSKQCNHIQRGAVSLRHGHPDIDRVCIQLPYLNPSSIGVVPNSLASHAHVILTSHIVFQDICRGTHTHGLQGYSSRCLVKAEQNSFEYIQTARIAGDNNYIFFTAC